MGRNGKDLQPVRVTSVCFKPSENVNRPPCAQICKKIIMAMDSVPVFVTKIWTLRTAGSTINTLVSLMKAVLQSFFPPN